MSRSIDMEGGFLDRLLMIQSLLEHERRLKSIEQKVNLIIKELSILEVIFEENREGRTSLSIGPKDRVTASEEFVYFQKLLKMLEILGKTNEYEEKL